MMNTKIAPPMRKRVLYKPQPAQSIFTPPLIPEVSQTIYTIMHNHGGRVEYIDAQTNCFSFPVGTVKEEIWPRTMTLRYKILFPDGYILFETYNPLTDQSNIRFLIDELPIELQENFQQLINHQRTNSGVELA